MAGGFFGGDAGGVLAYWESIGVFSYILPFLLIFALTFGILTRTKIFKENKAINGIIALTVGLLSLQFGFVSIFFSEIFPKLGIGLAIILMFLILVGLFSDPDKGWATYIPLGLGIIIFLVVVVQSFEWAGSSWSWWFYDNWPKLLSIAVLLALVGVVIGAGKQPSTKPEAKGLIFRPEF
ncbi:MAG: hypothetical protein KJ905_03445 [Nanoarchaeota archaeon]|nr:hypothetical protein [Nanoarchaeota archaeon]MBU1501799.1 hypothetical protein [Nanoarchaeota archaeon]MBU2459333.1 hypothetical protein [Nanoarchaeota archaeon]